MCICQHMLLIIPNCTTKLQKVLLLPHYLNSKFIKHRLLVATPQQASVYAQLCLDGCEVALMMPEETSNTATERCAGIPRKPSKALWTAVASRSASLLPALLHRCQLDPVPRGCQSHTGGPAHLSSCCRQRGRRLTEVMSRSRLCEGFPLEIQLACAQSKSTRTPTNSTQYHPHVAPRRQGPQSAWWISALTHFSSSGPIRKTLFALTELSSDWVSLSEPTVGTVL